jgi:hypothetical protein
MVVRCILVSSLVLGITPTRTHAQRALTPAPGARVNIAPDPDALYAQRQDIAKAKQAADIWQARSAGGKDYEASWKLARACYYLGTLGPAAEQQAQLDRGINAGKQAATLEPNKPEGHFWYAANMGERAQHMSFFTAGKYKAPIRTELERVIQIQAGWQGASAESALGEWYLKVPGIAGGDNDKGIELLRKALSYDTTNKQVQYSLAEALADNSKTREEARTLLQQVIAAPIDPDWAPEDRNFKVKAQALLDKLTKE